MHNSIDVRRYTLTFFSAGVLKYVLNNACGTFAVLANFSKVFPQVGHNVVDVVCIVCRQLVEIIIEVVAEIIKQRVGQFTEVYDEVERIAYFVYDASSQQT